VAPSQYECAPTFGEVNLANDQNTLLQEIMEKVSEKHGLKVLFHEKPFAGVNGSGKHNNWALGTNTGVNLLAPTSKPKDNLRFLTFLIVTIKAVHDNDDLLRASIATAPNDFRLGANEAPPAIMSVFNGETLDSILNELETNSNVKISKGDNVYLKLGISKIPAILKDNTDRNRTSPFAFTGNKFEFRAVGSSANNASAMTVLNTIVADTLVKFKDDVEKEIKKVGKKEVAIINILRKYVTETKRIRFEGNGYSEEWVKEAEKRGLKNVKNTPEALDFWVTEKSEKIF
jgi:glutamine synthetase